VEVQSTPETRVSDLLSNGVDIEILHDLVPHTLLAGLHLNSAIDGNASLTSSLKHIKRLLRNAKYWQQGRAMAQSVNPEGLANEVLFDYTAAGVVSQSSSLDVKEVVERLVSIGKSISMSELNAEYDSALLQDHLVRLAGLTALQVPLEAILPYEMAKQFFPDLEEGEWKMNQKNVDRI